MPGFQLNTTVLTKENLGFKIDEHLCRCRNPSKQGSDRGELEEYRRRTGNYA